VTFVQHDYEPVDVAPANTCVRKIQNMDMLLSLDVLNDGRISLIRDLDVSQAEGVLS